MENESVLKLGIAKANDKEDGISVTIDIPRRSKKTSEKLIKILNPKENDKFIVFSDDNMFHIDLNDYFKTESTVEEIIEGIEKIEDDIATVRDMGMDVFFSTIEEDDIDTRLVAEKLVEEDVDRHMMKDDLFDCYSGDIVDTAINCFENKELVEFIIDCATNEIIKRTTILRVMLNCYCEYYYEYISETCKYVSDFEFKKLKSLCKKNKRTNQLTNWRS